MPVLLTWRLPVVVLPRAVQQLGVLHPLGVDAEGVGRHLDVRALWEDDAILQRHGFLNNGVEGEMRGGVETLRLAHKTVQLLHVGQRLSAPRSAAQDADGFLPQRAPTTAGPGAQVRYHEALHRGGVVVALVRRAVHQVLQEIVRPQIVDVGSG